MVEQNRSSKNIWSSKNGRAKKIGRAKSRANRPANLSCRTVRWGGSIEQNHNKTIVKSTFFARTNLLMNVFSQFWLSGGRHFGSLWGAIWSVILGERFWVSVGCHYGSAGGCPLGRLRAPIEQSWTLLPSRGFQEPPRGPKAPQSRYQRPHTGDACIATHRWRRMLCHASLLQYLQSKFFQSIENNFGIVSKIINL